MVSGFMFHVSSVRLLSPPETGGVPAGGGGMTQGQVKVLAVGTRHAVSAPPHDIILCLGGHGMPCPYGYPHCDVGTSEAEGVCYKLKGER